MQSLAQKSCRYLKGVGPKMAELLSNLGIDSVLDLLFHLPFRYEDRTKLSPLGHARPGMRVAVSGVIELTESTRFGKPRLLCRISDGSGFLTLRFFHFSKFQKEALKRGARIYCFGDVRFGPQGYEMAHPEYKILKPGEEVVAEERLTPVYSTTEGVAQKSWRKMMKEALKLLKESSLQELLPNTATMDLPSVKEALFFLHEPPANVDFAVLENGQHAMQRRLILEELVAHHLSLRALRRQSDQSSAKSLIEKGDLIERFLKQLPFQLTDAQMRVIFEIKRDLQKSHPMMRLVQGDVGSGKTVVAAISALMAVMNDQQVAIMAPTELLAEQHLNHFEKWFSPLGIDVIWLSGQTKGKARKSALEKIASLKKSVVIGTHALFQKEVEFCDLGLVIIDEQHRFGVHQRLALHEKGKKKASHPHQLVMTATPIPRTLAMSAYADLDHSIIDELPPGRTPVATVLVSNQRRMEVISRIRQACQKGRQVYWVCTLIEESEVLQCEAAEETERLLKECLPGLSIALIHGRMKAVEKEALMSDFKAGKIQLLVATTVIEVGVDVPNASLMVIENAERLGLAQLHQLRGRVGRGSQESHAVLLYQQPLSATAKLRLKTMKETADGFLIAEKDLKIRGPGELLGVKQSGLIQMRIADVIRDKLLFPKVHQISNVIESQLPQNIKPLIDRWLGRHSSDYRLA